MGDYSNGRKSCAFRPLLHEPPLTIENLPSRVTNRLKSLNCETQSSCQPLNDESCRPHPQTICPPYPPQICYPPSCPPMFCCPPQFSCPPQNCMPVPNCCPRPPCPPPVYCPPQETTCNPCAKLPTTTKCCGAGATLVRVKKGQCQRSCKPCRRSRQPPVINDECSSGTTFGPPSMDKPASYNNCNFYVTELPKGMRKSMCQEDGCDTQEQEDDNSCPVDCSDEGQRYEKNPPAGDCKVVPPPVGYPGSCRLPWGNDNQPIKPRTNTTNIYLQGGPTKRNKGTKFGNPMANAGTEDYFSKTADEMVSPSRVAYGTGQTETNYDSFEDRYPTGETYDYDEPCLDIYPKPKEPYRGNYTGGYSAPPTNKSRAIRVDGNGDEDDGRGPHGRGIRTKGGYAGGEARTHLEGDYCIPQDHQHGIECVETKWRRVKGGCCQPKKPERLKTLCQKCHHRNSPPGFDTDEHCGLPMPLPTPVHHHHTHEQQQEKHTHHNNTNVNDDKENKEEDKHHHHPHNHHHHHKGSDESQRTLEITQSVIPSSSGGGFKITPGHIDHKVQTDHHHPHYHHDFTVNPLQIESFQMSRNCQKLSSAKSAKSSVIEPKDANNNENDEFFEILEPRSLKSKESLLIENPLPQINELNGFSGLSESITGFQLPKYHTLKYEHFISTPLSARASKSLNFIQELKRLNPQFMQIGNADINANNVHVHHTQESDHNPDNHSHAPSDHHRHIHSSPAHHNHHPTNHNNNNRTHHHDQSVQSHHQAHQGQYEYSYEPQMGMQEHCGYPVGRNSEIKRITITKDPTTHTKHIQVIKKHHQMPMGNLPQIPGIDLSYLNGLFQSPCEETPPPQCQIINPYQNYQPQCELPPPPPPFCDPHVSNQRLHVTNVDVGTSQTIKEAESRRPLHRTEIFSVPKSSHAVTQFGHENPSTRAIDSHSLSTLPTPTPTTQMTLSNLNSVGPFSEMSSSFVNQYAHHPQCYTVQQSQIQPQNNSYMKSSSDVVLSRPPQSRIPFNAPSHHNTRGVKELSNLKLHVHDPQQGQMQKHGQIQTTQKQTIGVQNDTQVEMNVGGGQKLVVSQHLIPNNPQNYQMRTPNILTASNPANYFNNGITTSTTDINLAQALVSRNPPQIPNSGYFAQNYNNSGGVTYQRDNMPQMIQTNNFQNQARVGTPYMNNNYPINYGMPQEIYNVNVTGQPQGGNYYPSPYTAKKLGNEMESMKEIYGGQGGQNFVVRRQERAIRPGERLQISHQGATIIPSGVTIDIPLPNKSNSKLGQQQAHTTAKAQVHVQQNTGPPKLIPLYRTTTQTQMQIVERPNQPSEVKIVKKPIVEFTGYQSVTNAGKVNVVEMNQGKGQQGNNGPKNTDFYYDDETRALAKTNCYRGGGGCGPTRVPCVPLRPCQSPRLITCRGQKPIFSAFPPKCPIKETMASILKKKPPANCKWHEKDVPPYYDYCMPNSRYRDPLHQRIEYVEHCDKKGRKIKGGGRGQSNRPGSSRGRGGSGAGRGVKRRLNQR